jgi:hypothetical protein
MSPSRGECHARQQDLTSASQRYLFEPLVVLVARSADESTILQARDDGCQRGTVDTNSFRQARLFECRLACCHS